MTDAELAEAWAAAFADAWRAALERAGWRVVDEAWEERRG